MDFVRGWQWHSVQLIIELFTLPNHYIQMDFLPVHFGAKHLTKI